MPDLNLPGSPPLAALRWCRVMTRVHSQTFYLGSLLYPRRQRLAVWAVYAACRVGDDIADEYTGAGARVELDRWWARVCSAFCGNPGDDPMQTALAWATREYPIPLDAFAELYEGFCMDLTGQSYDSLDDLTLYCRRVAGVVGFMVAPIGGYRGGAHTLEQALMLGQAMQLTNILRDVGEDLSRGRVYLPAELLSRFGVTHADLQAGRVTPEYRALMAQLCGLAREWYARGREGIPALEGRARVGVAAAARTYEGILDDLEAHGYDNFSRRAHVPPRHKLRLLWQEYRAHSSPASACPVAWAEQQYLRLKGLRG
ncbi:phytoene/squalene synthase family protein [Deinococcus deserti]|uniref:Putative phytoene synthase n=1 Tax=Deinococcus deserti (strain DSM 17065 / CIP 109153 / LMG 22923 / VCD115) TaxID=546414 RepID=C1D2Z3_DEIDV|nr:phytoene/squalene synthase family protein [Deinococcus deserti]ACO47782.1 putative phytoene synthase [Deinococcus deserti VCD115]